MLGTSTELELTRLWQDVLRREDIDTGEDFYALGGNSLQAGRIVALARKQFDVELTFNDFFREPTVRRLAARVDELRRAATAANVAAADEDEMARLREKRRRLEQALAPRAGNKRVSPISPSQHNLWLLGKFRPDVALHNEAFQCRLSGDLDVPALQAAFEQVVRRHEILLSHFGEVGTEPVQVIEDRDSVPFAYYGLDDVPPADRWAAAVRLRDELFQDALRPDRWPLLRLMVFAVGDGEHLMVLHVHHLVFDGASSGVFLDDLVESYRALRTGVAPSLPELGLQYADFALWQRSQLTGAGLDDLVGYWREQLADLPGVLDLPADRPAAAAEPDFTAAELTVPIPPALREKISAVARLENVTPFVVLLTAMCSLLVRRSGVPDVCVGTPVANRVRSGIDGLIGCFVNSLALRPRFGEDITYGQALDEVHRVTTGALEHQGLPFERLVEALRPPRRPGRGPFFQVWFAAQDERAHPREAAGLTFANFGYIEPGLTIDLENIDLSWVVSDRDDQMVLLLRYRTCMFDESTIVAMAAEYRARLEEIVADRGLGFSRPAVQAESIGDRILMMWRRALANDDIGPDDDFFECGGYSMVAVELVSSVQEQWGVEIAFGDFFDNPTAAGMAELIAVALAEDRGGAGPIVRSQDERSLDEILAEIELAVGPAS